MSEREYYNRMRKDLQALKKEVLSFDAKRRKECGYMPTDIPKSISHTGRPVSANEFQGRLQQITASSLWLQSILDRLNGLTTSYAIDNLKICPIPRILHSKAHPGRKPLGPKTQERLLQKGFSEAQNKSGIGMRSWIKSSQQVSEELAGALKEMLDSGEPLLFQHVDEDGIVTSEADPKRQRAFLDSREVMKNHKSESLLRALAKGKQSRTKK